MLSVLMPALNAQDTVRLALRSTLRAMRPEDELLVLDDGSSDDTHRSILSVRDSRVRVISNATPSGVASGLNQLLTEARGAHVARMDADDVTLPRRFVRQMKHLNQGVDLSFTTRINFGNQITHWRPSAMTRVSHHMFPKRLLRGNVVPHSTLVTSARVLRSQSGPYRQTPAEDYDLWLRLACEGYRLERLALPGIAYRLHRGQVTRDPRWLEKVAADALLNESLSRLRSALGQTGP